MPFKSEAQRRLMWALHPEIAKRWAKKQHGTKDQPQHVPPSLSTHSTYKGK